VGVLHRHQLLRGIEREVRRPAEEDCAHARRRDDLGGRLHVDAAAGIKRADLRVLPIPSPRRFRCCILQSRVRCLLFGSAGQAGHQQQEQRNRAYPSFHGASRQKTISISINVGTLSLSEIAVSDCAPAGSPLGQETGQAVATTALQFRNSRRSTCGRRTNMGRRRLPAD
jgi:hypothetical protein